jgi:hypothetical protein
LQGRNLPKLAVETTLYVVKLARTFQMLSHAVKIDSNKANDVVAEAKSILVDANELCQQKFQNADVHGNAIEEALRLLGKE